MIIVRLMGGLGNQMFQYAAGRAIAYRNNTSLKLDISSFKHDPHRSYSLNCFNIIEDFANGDEIKHLKSDQYQLLSFPYNKIKQKMIPWHKQNIIIERSFNFDSDILKIKGNAYLDGYWQSEKNFLDISNIIRSDFSFKEDLDDVNKCVLSTIQWTNSVCLHIRRGDYISSPKTLETHGVLGTDYYMKSLDIIKKRVINPHLFVFSDDMSWARENIKCDLPTQYIDYNGPKKDFKDLRLMSNCKHHIIANSSFSWWGAWLGKKEENIIIAPAKWFNKKYFNPEDLFPTGWIIIN